jgi:Flp pilus assembly protein CpaB
VLLSETARSQVVGKVTARTIAAGEPVLASALAQGLPLEPQEVALALPVVDRVYVPHQVQPGDRGLLYAIGAGQGGAQQAVLVSDRVRVLAVVRSRQQAGAGQAPRVNGHHNPLLRLRLRLVWGEGQPWSMAVIGGINAS